MVRASNIGGKLVGALSAKIEINHCSIKNIFKNVLLKIISPNQVLTHAARAAAKQPPLVAARGAREGLWLEQQNNNGFRHSLSQIENRYKTVRALTLRNCPNHSRLNELFGAYRPY